MALNEFQADILRELINIGVGRSAGILNQMSSSHIDLNVPEIRILAQEDMFMLGYVFGSRKVSAIRLMFDGAFSGRAALVFPPDSASSIVSLIIGAEEIPFDHDSLRIGALQELGNIVLNGVMGSITNILHRHIQYYPPEYCEDTIEHIINHDENAHKNMILLVRAHFNLEHKLIEGDIVIVFHLASFALLINAIDDMISAENIQ